MPLFSSNVKPQEIRTLSILWKHNSGDSGAPVPFVRGIDRGRGKHCLDAFVRRFNRRVGNHCCRMSLFMSFLENFALEIAD